MYQCETSALRSKLEFALSYIRFETMPHHANYEIILPLNIFDSEAMVRLGHAQYKWSKNESYSMPAQCNKPDGVRRDVRAVDSHARIKAQQALVNYCVAHEEKERRIVVQQREKQAMIDEILSTALSRPLSSSTTRGSGSNPFMNGHPTLITPRASRSPATTTSPSSTTLTQDKTPTAATTTTTATPAPTVVDNVNGTSSTAAATAEIATAPSTSIQTTTSTPQLSSDASSSSTPAVHNSLSQQLISETNQSMVQQQTTTMGGSPLLVQLQQTTKAPMPNTAIRSTVPKLLQPSEKWRSIFPPEGLYQQDKKTLVWNQYETVFASELDSIRRGFREFVFLDTRWRLNIQTKPKDKTTLSIYLYNVDIEQKKKLPKEICTKIVFYVYNIEKRTKGIVQFFDIKWLEEKAWGFTSFAKIHFLKASENHFIDPTNDTITFGCTIIPLGSSD